MGLFQKIAYASEILKNKYFSLKYSCSGNEKNILVILERPGIGDAMLCLDGLLNLATSTKNKDEYHIYLAAGTTHINLLRNLNCLNEFNVIEVDFSLENRMDTKKFKRNFDALNICYWDSIVALDRVGGFVKALFVGLSYKKIYLPEYEYKLIQRGLTADNIINNLLNNIQIEEFYNVNLKSPNEADVCRNQIMKVMPNLEYYSERINTLNKAKASFKSEYCVICAGIAKGHDNQFRKWQIEKFVEVAKYILDNTNLNIVLCGTKDDERENYLLEEALDNSNRVINITNKTNFSEWAQTLKNAKFVFGNDSGYIHLAAKLGVQAFVIAGYWNYGRFLPYPEFMKDLPSPIDIRVEQPECSLCNHYKHDNKTKLLCDQCVKERGIYKCIEDISANQAIVAVREFLEVQ